MPLIALASVKGSPGVTTTALALAAVWPAPRRLLAEFDPAGGDLAVRLGLPAGRGLAGLAAAARRPAAHRSLWPHAWERPGGLHVLAAPAGAEQATACLQTLTANGAARQLAGEAATADAIVIADCGRLDPATPAAAMTGAASMLAVVARPHLGDLVHLAGRLDTVTDPAAQAGGLILAPATGADPVYPGREITQALGIPVLASLPADPRAATALTAGTTLDQKMIRRLSLLRAALALAAAIQATLRPDTAGTALPAAPEAFAAGPAVAGTQGSAW